MGVETQTWSAERGLDKLSWPKSCCTGIGGPQGHRSRKKKSIEWMRGDQEEVEG